MIEIGMALLIAGISYALQYVIGRIQFWREKQDYIQQNSGYIEQLEKMDAKYRPEKPDVEMALRCKEYLSQVFPNGINERTQNMSKEELLSLFRRMVEDTQLLMGVNIGTVDFYSTDEPPTSGYCGYYCHSDMQCRLPLM